MSEDCPDPQEPDNLFFWVFASMPVIAITALIFFIIYEVRQ